MMRALTITVVMLVALALPVSADSGLPGKWEKILANACNFTSSGARVECLSRYFLGTPYVADTLGGGPDITEHLVVNLNAVDCFTLIDYVEVMRRIVSPEAFQETLIAVRYRDGVVSWSTRRHFFSDWLQEGAVIDVTADLAPHAVQKVDKVLNRAADGTSVLAEVEQRQRVITYLPTDTLNPAIVASLLPGDYVGIYSPEPWLDVSHVGILVRKGKSAYLRHASSRPGKTAVIDEPLPEYLEGTPGVVVLRPVAP